MSLEKVYKNKKVFVTGHTGFKGSWFISWLHLLGAHIKGYALAPQRESDIYHAIHGDELCESVIADIRDEKKLRDEIISFQPDFIFHLAAQPLVRLSYDIPVDTFSVNALGTVHVLDAVRYLDKACAVVIITTDKVYQNLESDHYYKEGDRLGGHDPYSASKAAAEIVTDCYRNSFFNPAQYNRHKKSVSVARAGNVIGGGDWSKDRIIPDIIRALHGNNAIPVRNPASVRPWQHVLEPLSGYLLLAAKQSEEPVRFATAFNFGPHPADNMTVLEIVEEAIRVWGEGSFFTPENRNAVHEAGLLQLDITKSLRELHWEPKYTAKQAIDKTISWYKQTLQEGESAAAMIRMQINSYMN